MHIARAGACLRGFRQSLGRYQHGGFDVRRRRRPGQLANGEPEPIGGRQNHGLAGYLDTNSGQHRQRVIPACGHRDLADRLGEQLGGDDPGLIGQGRQRRVVLDRHGRQGEFRAAAVQQHPRAFHADIHRFGRKRPCDVRQQPSGHQNASRRSYLGCNLYFGRHFVVESRDGQAIVGTCQQHAGEHRNRRPGRQVTSHPGHRVGEVFAHEPALQIGETNRRCRHVHSVPSINSQLML